MSQTGKLLKLIQDQGLQPGDKLPSERDLALQFGMSRASLREALIRLETLRIVELRPKSGIYLRLDPSERSVEALVLYTETNTPVNEPEVKQAVEVRRIIELQGVRLACERRTDDDLKKLWDILSRSQSELLDHGTLELLDPEFHLAVLSCTQNQLLMQVAHVYYMISRVRRAVYFSDPEQNLRSHRQHMALFEAIKSRDAAAAQAIMDSHLQGVGDYFEEYFEKSADAEVSTQTD